MFNRTHIKWVNAPFFVHRSAAFEYNQAYKLAQKYLAWPANPRQLGETEFVTVVDCR